MSTEIGYNVYNPETGKIVSNEHDDWMCGRNDITECWNQYFNFAWENDKNYSPIFVKEYDNVAIGEIKRKYVSIDDFISAVSNDLDYQDQENVKVRNSISCSNYEYKARIKELRELQRDCTKNQSYAFDKWNDEIDDIRQEMKENEDFLNENEDGDRINTVRKMLADMKADHDKGLIVLPYYSF